MTVEVLEKTELYAVAVWRRVMLLVWRGQIRAAGVDGSQALFRAWVHERPGAAALLVVVPRQPPGPPDEETRAAMARASEDPPVALAGTATLLEAHGFIAATVRSIISRVYRRHARGLGVKVFCAVEEAAPWAAELLGDPAITPEGLAAAIRVARAG
ncbi:MAG TPA: hypothetical protein VEB43_16965 [Anaeromyxobacter sp.]|nr:hypothetical protein [Anaeromyxobacter sp.]